MRKYMNTVLVAVVCVLIMLLIAKEHKINELQLENRELANKIVLDYIEEEEANRAEYVRDGIYLYEKHDHSEYALAFADEYIDYLDNHCTNHCEDCNEYYYYICNCYDDDDFLMYLEDMYSYMNQE